MASPEAAREPRWLSLPAIAAVIVLLASGKLFVAAHTGLSFDESYYTFWSTRLATGYLDHPPAVAWLIAAGRALLGNSELGVRLFAVMCGLGTSAAIWRIGALLLDRTTAGFAVLLYNVTPSLGLGFLITPDPPSALFWAATLWAIAEFTTSGRAWWWLVAGALAGLGLWSKYTDAFLAPGILLWLLVSGERRPWLVRWPVWVASVVAIVVFLPVIVWNAQRDWASFKFQGQRTVSEGIDPNWLGNLGELLSGQALYMGPVLVLLALGGILMFLARPSRRPGLALPVLTMLPALAYFAYHTLHARVEANWLIPLWPELSLVAAAAVVALWQRARWLAAGILVLQAAIGLGAIGAVYAQALWQPFDLGVLDRTTETRGWAKLQGEFAGLAATNGAHWIATAGNFGVTGEMASYFLFAKSPLPVRQVDEPMRWAFLPPLDVEALGWPALFVRIEPNPEAPQPPSDLFGQAKLVGVMRRDGGKAPLEAWSAFVVSAPTEKVFAR